MTLYVILIFIIELLWSYFASWLNLAVVMRKKKRALLYGILTSSIAWIIPWIIYVETKSWILMIPAVVGSTLGDLLVAGRKSKRIKLKRKKLPFSTA